MDLEFKNEFDLDEVKSGWGLDYCWAKALDYKDIGVIDWCVAACACCIPTLDFPSKLGRTRNRVPLSPPPSMHIVHTKAPAGLDALATNSFYRRYSIRPVAEMNETLRRFRVSFRPPHKVGLEWRGSWNGPLPAASLALSGWWLWS